MSTTSTEEIEDILAELLLDRSSVQEQFLCFLVMEPFIRQLRSKGLSNLEILELCRRVDEGRENE